MMRTATAIAAVLLLTACTSPTPPGAQQSEVLTVTDVTVDESARLNDWFEVKFQEMVARSPMTQTYLGIKDNYGQWDDASDAHALGDLELQRATLPK